MYNIYSYIYMSNNSQEEIKSITGQYRGWCMTVFEDRDQFIKDFEEEKFRKQLRYYVIGKEICPETKKPHLQVFVYYKSLKKFNQINNKFPRIRLRPKYKTSTPTQAAEYCKKDDDYIEWGEVPVQGDRTDLKKVKDEILSGEITVQDILREDPDMYHQYNKTLYALEDLRLSDNIRTEMTLGVWIYGKTGKGKSTAVAEFVSKYCINDYYIWKNDSANKWNDNYKQQTAVIIPDFRGGLKYGDLLNMVDRGDSFYASRRARAPVPFNSKYVLITSSESPESIYSGISSFDSIDQFYRRFIVINLDKEDIDETKVIDRRAELSVNLETLNKNVDFVCNAISNCVKVEQDIVIQEQKQEQ